MRKITPSATMPAVHHANADLYQLARDIRTWGRALGFDDIGIADIDLSAAEPGLQAWLDAGWNGTMHYMSKHGTKRSRPDELVPGTVRVICARMAYLPNTLPTPSESEVASAPYPFSQQRDAEFARLEDPNAAVVSVYARGDDYHLIMRDRLRQLAQRIEQAIGPFGYRVFADSAPVLEVELAQKAHLGWRGKHTLLLHREAGSFFFLGEIYVDIPLPIDAIGPSTPVKEEKEPRVRPTLSLQEHKEAVPTPPKTQCGHCTRCIDACPTGAIVAPYRLDARLCISYLTIELKESIPVDLRPLIGNRIYGCDDCQLVCPWNKFAKRAIDAFDVRNGLDRASLITLFAWTEAEFKERLAHSAILRIGHERWLRNIAVAMGNALRQAHSVLSAAQREAIIASLRERLTHPSALVLEHIQWALEAA